MPHVTLVLHNADDGGLDSIVFYDDGMIGIAEEKCWILIGGDGNVIERAWKKSPQSAHFQAYAGGLSQVGGRPFQQIAVPGWADAENSCSPFSSLVFAITRKHQQLLNC